MPDMRQFNNPAIPVVVVRVVSGPNESKENPETLIKEVIVENRSQKEVTSLTVRWAISPINNRLTTFREGAFQTHVLRSLHKTLLAGKRQTLKVTDPKIDDMLGDVKSTEAMGDTFVILVGVAEVVFEDGTTWEEKKADVVNKVSKPEPRIHQDFIGESP